MSTAPAEVLRWGREQARAGHWRGDGEVAFLSPLPDTPLPSVEFLRRCLDTLAARGYRRVVTGALSPVEQAGFLAVGFGVEQRLHLLTMELQGPSGPLSGRPGPGLRVPPGLPLRRVSKRSYPAVLAVDRAAFSSFWRLDASGLGEALAATPAVRFRAAVHRDRPGRGLAGYAICGRSGRRGFVQRLAVDPDWQRSGTGRRLLLDGLAWMQRRGVARAVVNTQVGNDAALALYLQTGFTEEPAGLSVLSAGLA